MEITETLARAKAEGWTDEEVVERVLRGDTALYEIIMRRYNQRLYRVARAILRDDAEAEDVLQSTYVRAYEYLSQFEGRSAFAAWLTRITVHEALGRVRLRGRTQPLEEDGPDGEFSMNLVEESLDPEQSTSQAEAGQFLEAAILSLPRQYRAVVMLRDVEELNTAETADALELSEDNVKVRLHRGHAMIRSWLFARVGANAKEAFPFMADRCDRVVSAVFRQIASRQI
jgi:RNA polymerase sigma-70 factor, ECF subfamily